MTGLEQPGLVLNDHGDVGLPVTTILYHYFLFILFLTIDFHVPRIIINITKMLQMTTLSNYMRSFGQIFLHLATHSMVY